MKYSEMKEQALKVGGVSDLTPTFFEFKAKGDEFVGRLKSISQVESGLTETTYNQYLFEGDEGLIKCAFGAATDKELASLLKLNNVYVVEFLGKVRISGGRQVNKFKVLEIDEAALPKDKGKDDVPF